MAIDNLALDVTAVVDKEEEKAVKETIWNMVSDLAEDISALRRTIPTREIVPIETMAINAVCNAYEKVLSGRQHQSQES